MRDDMLAASWFAEVDPYRAATHNKGIMNGVSAVALVTAEKRSIRERDGRSMSGVQPGVRGSLFIILA